uniref:Uncharacterized protein n=1 Tax=Rhodnius prolixus TaxID=13249 RepID=T1I8U7_RHOPR
MATGSVYTDDDEESGGSSRAQYVSANCVVFTHYTGDVAAVVDEHFTRALATDTKPITANSKASCHILASVCRLTFEGNSFNNVWVKTRANITSDFAGLKFRKNYFTRGVIINGSETWTLTAADERALRCWERKVLRIIYGPVVENGTYRSRKNAELMALYEEADVVKGIKIGRLRWLGHLHRMEEGRAPRKAYEGHPGGRRPRGRPRLKWLEKVEEDLDKLRVRQWRRKAMDRSDWDKVLSEAKALQGL